MSKTVKLIEIAKIIGSGITPRRDNSEYWEGGTIPWLKTEQLGEYKIYDTSEKISQIALSETSIKIFPANTLSIAMYGEGRTRGNISILKSPMTTNQACCNVVIDKDKADYEYVYYFLKTQYKQLRSLSSGVRNNLNSNDIKEFEIRLPNAISTQQRIASVLSSLDAKIELNNRINRELEQMAKLLYDYWFVQFEFPPSTGSGNDSTISGNASTCTTTEKGALPELVEGRGYKSSGGKMVWNEELKREIPEGWKVKSLGEICNIYQPQTISEKEMSDDGKYLVFGANGIVGKYSKFNHTDSEIAVTCRGNTCGNIIRTYPYSWITGNAMVLKFIDKDIHNEYLYCGLQWINIKRAITGSAQPQITRASLSPLKIVMPDKELLIEYSNLIESNVLKRLQLVRENQHSPHYVTGCCPC